MTEMTQLPIQTPLTVISGGQTGADVGGISAAKKLGIHTTGWATKGFMTEKGAQPVLGSAFNLVEHASSQYPPRTAENVKDSDVTVIFSPKADSKGTAQTIAACHKYDRAYMVFSELSSNTHMEVLAFLQLHRAKVINIAGNRETISPGLAKQVKDILLQTLRWYKSDVEAGHF